MKLKNVEHINGIRVVKDGGNAKVSNLVCEDVSSIQEYIDPILDKHPDWIVGEVNFKYGDGALRGEVTFSLPAPAKPKNKRYRVTWREVYLCMSEVEAPNKKAARQLAEENFADDKEWDESKDWVVSELKV